MRTRSIGVARRPDEAGALAASLVTATTLAVAFGALAVGIPWFWVAFPVGFGGVLPVAVSLARRRASESGGDRCGSESRSTDRGRRPTTGDHRGPERADDRRAPTADRRRTDPDAALATLRERYARGEIDDVEFEERVEALVATENEESTPGRRATARERR